MKRIEPLSCQCGRKSCVSTFGRFHYVTCTWLNCWVGPLCKKRADAVKKWNRLMVVAEISRDVKKFSR